MAWTARKGWDPPRGEELTVSLSPTQPQALGVAGVLRGPTAPLKGTLPPTSLMPRTCQLFKEKGRAGEEEEREAEERGRAREKRERMTWSAST